MSPPVLPDPPRPGACVPGVTQPLRPCSVTPTGASSAVPGGTGTFREDRAEGAARSPTGRSSATDTAAAPASVSALLVGIRRVTATVTVPMTVTVTVS